MFIVGIDIAKRSHEATIITSEGDVVQRAFSFRNNCSGYNVLLGHVRKLTNQRNQIVFDDFLRFKISLFLCVRIHQACVGATSCQ